MRCIYIDPPYNNQEHYNHYRDDLDHDSWLFAISERLELLSDFLAEDGSLWISIDDKEVHYLKVLADKILGRQNFVTTIVWQQRTTRENRRVFSNNHEYILVYAKNLKRFAAGRNGLPAGSELRDRYKNPDKDSRGPWQSVSANVQAGHGTPSQFYTIVAPNGRRHAPPNGRCWVYSEAKMKAEIARNNVWFGRDGNGVPRLKRFLGDKTLEVTPETLWFSSEVATNDSAKKHFLQLFPKRNVFDTPKPEGLIHRILHIATNPNDLVLDCYLGSGTTTAVAHKMSRRYIGVEQGMHASTLCAQRMRMVVDGEHGGVSEKVNWRGGGGFYFYKLGS
ncbi:MAG: site-specific DNA-methyltransferase [Betaproteobacteria bacterium]